MAHANDPARTAAARTPEKLLERARSLRQDLTFPERLLWSRLRRHALFGIKFKRQHVVGPYVVDFCAAAHRVVVELDGASHDHPRQHAIDQRRDAWLRAEGYSVLRVTNDDVLQSLEGVLATIARACGNDPQREVWSGRCPPEK